MYWLLPPFFLFAIAGGGIMVPKLNLILSLVCRGYLIDRASDDPNFMMAPVLMGGDNPQCRSIPEVQALATRFTLYITIITGAFSAIMSPKLGALSDRYGRLKILCIASGGATLGEIITILAATYPEQMSYNWLLLGAACDGLCGSFTAGMAITHAYAADCTAPPKRAVAFGYFHACLFSGIAIGPLIAAFLVRTTDSLISTFYFALAVHAFFILFVFFVVPESLTKKRQALARERHHSELLAYNTALGSQDLGWQVMLRRANILAPLKILYPTGPGTSGKLRANLILLSAVDTIIFGVALGALTVVVYYCGYQFGWDTAQISVFTSIVNSFRVTALVVVLPLLNYLVRTRRANRQRRESGFAVPEPNSGSDNLDLWIIRSAVCFEIVGYGLYATVRTGPLFVVAGMLAALGGVGSPTLQSALTKHVPHDRMGQLLGATGLLHALARIVCPLVFNLIYAGTVATFPQAVFVVLSSYFVLGFILSWGIRPHGKSLILHFNKTSILTPTVYLEDSATSARTDDDPDILTDEEVTGM